MTSGGGGSASASASAARESPSETRARVAAVEGMMHAHAQVRYNITKALSLPLCLS